MRNTLKEVEANLKNSWWKFEEILRIVWRRIQQRKIEEIWTKILRKVEEHFKRFGREFEQYLKEAWRNVEMSTSAPFDISIWWSAYVWLILALVCGHFWFDPSIQMRALIDLPSKYWRVYSKTKRCQFELILAANSSFSRIDFPVKLSTWHGTFWKVRYHWHLLPKSTKKKNNNRRIVTDWKCF